MRFSTNRKVCNATECLIEGVQVRSKAERDMWLLLRSSGLSFDYEPSPMTLLEGFRPSTVWYKGGRRQTARQLPMTYTPDFVVRVTDRVRCIVEVKGFRTDRYEVKRKLLLDHLNRMNASGDTITLFFEVLTLKDMCACVAEMLNIQELTDFDKLYNHEKKSKRDRGKDSGTE